MSGTRGRGEIQPELYEGRYPQKGLSKGSRIKVAVPRAQGNKKRREHNQKRGLERGKSRETPNLRMKRTLWGRRKSAMQSPNRKKIGTGEDQLAGSALRNFLLLSTTVRSNGSKKDHIGGESRRRTGCEASSSPNYPLTQRTGQKTAQRKVEGNGKMLNNLNKEPGEGTRRWNWGSRNPHEVRRVQKEPGPTRRE